MTDQRGLLCFIYRPVGGSCANGGISNRVDKVILVGPDIPEIFAPTSDTPAVELRVLGDEMNAEPVGRDNTWWMFGGAFIYTSDSRFPSRAPIALHDHCETREESEALSR
jgi:hypothetical protein